MSTSQVVVLLVTWATFSARRRNRRRSLHCLVSIAQKLQALQRWRCHPRNSFWTSLLLVRRSSPDAIHLSQFPVSLSSSCFATTMNSAAEMVEARTQSGFTRTGPEWCHQFHHQLSHHPQCSFRHQKIHILASTAPNSTGMLLILAAAAVLEAVETKTWDSSCKVQASSHGQI